MYNKYNTNYSNILGSGAAGGLAYGFLTFTNSEIKKRFWFYDWIPQNRRKNKKTVC